MSAITLPAEYGLVGAGITAIGVLNFWQSLQVSKARKLAKVDYPQAYAEVAVAKASVDAHKFNCSQRAHQNTLEHVPLVIATGAYFGVAHPKYAAVSLAIWVVGRVFYTLGYATGDPNKRFTGYIASALAGLFILAGAGYTAFQSIGSPL